MCKAKKSDHIHPILKTLHWLPVTHLIQYKISTVCFSSISGTAPEYLSDLLQPYTPARQIWSDLLQPYTPARQIWSDLLQPYTPARQIWSDLLQPYTPARQIWSDLLQPYTPARQIWSASDALTFATTRVNTKTFGERSFSYAGPTVWNNLPQTVRRSASAFSFKAALKTHLLHS